MAHIGTEIGYRFSVNGEHRTGRGVIIGDEDYSVWPAPGYTVRVTESPNYKTGEILHLCAASLAPVQP